MSITIKIPQVRIKDKHACLFSAMAREVKKEQPRGLCWVLALSTVFIAACAQHKQIQLTPSAQTDSSPLSLYMEVQQGKNGGWFIDQEVSSGRFVPTPTHWLFVNHGSDLKIKNRSETQDVEKENLSLIRLTFLFKSGEKTISNQYISSILTTEVVNQLRKSDEIFIKAYTDSIGSNSYNKRLSEERANFIRNTLIKKGISTEIITIGYGENNPSANNKTTEGRSKNRRVIISNQE